MRTIKYFLVAFALIFSLAWSCDDRPDEEIGVNPQLYAGPWTLVNVSGSIAGIDHDFENGVIIWDFADDGLLDVTNNNDDEAEDFLETGNNYYFGFTEAPDSSCGYNFYAHNTEFGCMEIEGNTMILTQQAADGYVLTFERLPIID